MPLRLFRKEDSLAARMERQEKLERAVVGGFRKLAEILKKTADLIEARRLERNGYHQQEKFLERAAPKTRR